MRGSFDRAAKRARSWLIERSLLRRAPKAQRGRADRSRSIDPRQTHRHELAVVVPIVNDRSVKNDSRP
ncbi:MAG: hypothetical protein BGO98_21375 [Myxococcales bacterium 68-20]|nr:MAG: hypothetical protein BGO98_21375 [Myxococcales bacterium 68-20]